MASINHNRTISASTSSSTQLVASSMLGFFICKCKKPKKVRTLKATSSRLKFFERLFFAAFEWVACFHGFGGKRKTQDLEKRSKIKISPKLNKLNLKVCSKQKNLVWLRPFDLLWLQKISRLLKRTFSNSFPAVARWLTRNRSLIRCDVGKDGLLSSC